MSVRAHELIEIKTGPEVFNLWHDDALRDYLEAGGFLDTLDMDGSGIISVPLEQFIEFLNRYKGEEDYSHLRAWIQKQQQAGKTEQDWIDFYCF